MKKLILIDGMAVVYRAYYALNRKPRVNSKGFNTSAVLGFSTTLYDLLRHLQPTHVGVAFDLQKPTFRHELYAEYKANRDAMPEDIQLSLPWVRQMIEAFRIPILTCEGFEADDVIGTLSHAAEDSGFDEVVMVTPDKDFAQLVTSRVKMYRFGRAGKPDQILSPLEVHELFGVNHCRQVIDLLGLWGDASDNIPGVPGVGEKTAKKLIAQFGSIEEIIAHADEISNNKARTLIQQYADQALFSKQLATIRLDAPIPFDPDQLLLQTPDFALLQQLTSELEFRQFARRIAADYNHPMTPSAATPQPRPDAASAADVAAPSHPGATPEAPSLFDQALPATQTPVQVQPLTAEVLRSLEGADVAIIVDGIEVALSTHADAAWVADLATLDHDAFSRLLLHPVSTKLCFDLKALIHLLHSRQLALAGPVFDVQLAHYLVDAEMRHTLDAIAASRIGFEPAGAAHQAAALWQLYPLLAASLRDASLVSLYSDVELPLVDVLVDMERTGVRIDTAALQQLAGQLSAERDDIARQIYQLAGTTFNIASPKQLADVLYQQLRVTDKPPLTASRQFSTAEDVLVKLASRHPVIPLILEYRSVSKLLDTYLLSFPKLINPATGRLHTIYHQTVTATGRLSSSNPNLQNIPIRTPRGRQIRAAIVPADDQHLILAADYSQIELRIIASLARDHRMLEAFNTHLDIHAATAARIFHLDIADVTPDQRRMAKSVNFGILYGISAFGLASQLSIPRSEASALISQYFEQYPDIRAFITQCVERARECGYASTLLGRRRYLPDINSRNAAARSFAERNAVNMPIQGTSADMIKLAMVRIHRQFAEQHLQSKMILQVHDELVFDLYRPEEEVVRDIVTREMQTALPLEGLPVEVSVGIGANWLEAH